MIDQERSGSDEGVPAAKKRQIRLRFRSSVLDGAQQPGIKPPQASERLGIHSVALAVVLIDETQPPRIGHDGLVTAFADEAAYPGRVGAGFEHHKR